MLRQFFPNASMLEKITVEDIYQYIRSAFLQMRYDKDQIRAAFSKCGYININSPNTLIEELSNSITAMCIEEKEDEEDIPFEIEDPCEMDDGESQYEQSPTKSQVSDDNLFADY